LRVYAVKITKKPAVNRTPMMAKMRHNAQIWSGTN
jgi:hypothetical protein